MMLDWQIQKYPPSLPIATATSSSHQQPVELRTATAHVAHIVMLIPVMFAYCAPSPLFSATEPDALHVVLMLSAHVALMCCELMPLC